MRTRDVRSIVATILAAVAVPTFIASTAPACGGTVAGSDVPTNTNPTNPTDPTTPTKTPPTPSVPYEAPFSCATDEAAYEALRVAIGADYIEVRRGSEIASDPSVTQTAVGVPCQTAQDADACATQLAAATSDQALFPTGQDGGNRYLVVTSGDTVTVVSTRAEMATLLGPIDHPSKAWLVARQQAYLPKCDSAWIVEMNGEWVLRTTRNVSDCPWQDADVVLRVTRAGEVSEVSRTLQPKTDACAGRRPRGLAPAIVTDDGSVVGRYLAHIAHLEAASVHAFRMLREELREHDAPEALVAAATRAIRDEIRHAAIMTRLAHRHGASVSPVVVEARVARSLEEMAIENAREGCVRELYGAVEAAWQAEAARDPEIAQVMRAIARDEARHADLALDVATWLTDKLGVEANVRVRAARIDALRELAEEVSVERARELEVVAGVPNHTQATNLVKHLEQALANAA